MTINMKTLISFIVCLCCATRIYAQLNLYKETKQIQGEGYTYQCKVSSTILVDLYNIEQMHILHNWNRIHGLVLSVFL